ncbi:MAG: hypothetical protein FD123_404 [Bacteroidetes bacterium]|nr:MAG: hypothetical protein FD123_404 [Bacteroidota bacterium]
MNDRSAIERKTAKILDDLQINELPIPVDKIATSYGLEVKPYDLGEDVSGVLVISNGVGIIGYNPNESTLRQRFTIAHEFGHFVLHGNIGGLFIDKGFRVEFRSQKSTTKEIRKEQEANAFAAALLMPEKILFREIKNHNYDLTEEGSIQELANLFNVSSQAMTFRLSNTKSFNWF